MDKALFAGRFELAASKARDFARRFIVEDLPDALQFRVRLNSSYDGNPLHQDEVVFPEDSAPEVAARLARVTMEQVVDTLWRSGRSPEWADLSVIGRTPEATLVEVLSCGRFTSNDDLLYHEREGHPPFHVTGPVLPVEWQEGQKFSLYHRSEAIRWYEVDLLADHAVKVWSLILVGDDFNDDALSGLPPFSGLEIAELTESPTNGPGLADLLRFPKLRVLRVALANPEGFTLPVMPVSKTVTTVALENLPGSPCGLDELLRALPFLESLELGSPDSLELAGAFGKRLKRLSITARQIRGAILLPRSLESVSLHLSEADADDVRRLLQPLRDVRAFHLRGTPIDGALVHELVLRCSPEYVDVVDTRMTPTEVRALVAKHPSLRTHPSIRLDDAFGHKTEVMRTPRRR